MRCIGKRKLCVNGHVLYVIKQQELTCYMGFNLSGVLANVNLFDR